MQGNPGYFSLWDSESAIFLLVDDPESWASESGIQVKESGIPLATGIRNPQPVKSRIQDCLGFPPYWVFSHEFTAESAPVPNQTSGELNSFLTQTISFVPINLHRCWPREWKHSIWAGAQLLIENHYWIFIVYEQKKFPTTLQFKAFGVPHEKKGRTSGVADEGSNRGRNNL